MCELANMLGSMNVFRVSADVVHLFSFYLLLHKIVKSKNATGISLRTQELTCIVFMCRYQDIIWDHDNMYNLVMKILFLGTTAIVIYAIRTWKRQKETYEPSHDNFSRLALVLPCLFISALMMLNTNAPVAFEFFWTFSICLESVSILPQLSLLMRERSVENLTSHYMAFLGLYRGLYIVNWWYKKYFLGIDTQLIVWVSGVIQWLLYCDFFYHYCKSKSMYGVNSNVILPR